MATLLSQSLNNVKILPRKILVNKKDIHVEFRGAAMIQLYLEILLTIAANRTPFAT
jgi:hypothetical protein